MDPYDIYRNGKEYFTPKTPIAALKAFEGDSFPYQLLSIFPIRQNL
jgi:hypothetical protein